MSFIDDQEAATRARAQDVALFRYRLIAPAIEPGLTGLAARPAGPRHRREGARRAGLLPGAGVP